MARSTMLAVVAAFALGPAAAHAQGAYDPLSGLDTASVRTIDLTVTDADRHREIPVLVYLPPASTAAPVVLFSHGLGGARTGSPFFGKCWAARGYVAVFLQHPGSDESVWQDVPRIQAMAALAKAANLENFVLRVDDVGAVLDQLARWNRTAGNPLAGRLDLDRVGMSGHSFGAVTTQAVSGQRFPGGRSLTDRRIKAALPISPSSPKTGTAATAFGAVPIPWLVMTGTKDTSPIGQADVASRLAVYQALPPGSKYELVLENAEHSAFTDRALPGDRQARNPNHHRAMVAISIAFWDAYLKADLAARAWLDGQGPRSVLESGDLWQRK